MEDFVVATLADHPRVSGDASSYLERGTARVLYYQPRGQDDQRPHEQDELYMIDKGSGYFMTEGKRCAVGPGDTIFVAARIPHRFEDFSADFGAWVVFYGPVGGEQ